jgi:hypothetical protein
MTRDEIVDRALEDVSRAALKLHYRVAEVRARLDRGDLETGDLGDLEKDAAAIRGLAAVCSTLALEEGRL